MRNDRQAQKSFSLLAPREGLEPPTIALTDAALAI